MEEASKIRLIQELNNLNSAQGLIDFYIKNYNKYITPRQDEILVKKLKKYFPIEIEKIDLSKLTQLISMQKEKSNDKSSYSYTVDLNASLLILETIIEGAREEEKLKLIEDNIEFLYNSTIILYLEKMQTISEKEKVDFIYSHIQKFDSISIYFILSQLTNYEILQESIKKFAPYMTDEHQRWSKQALERLEYKINAANNQAATHIDSVQEENKQDLINNCVEKSKQILQLQEEYKQLANEKYHE